MLTGEHATHGCSPGCVYALDETPGDGDQRPTVQCREEAYMSE